MNQHTHTHTEMDTFIARLAPAKCSKHENEHQKKNYTKMEERRHATHKKNSKNMENEDGEQNNSH